MTQRIYNPPECAYILEGMHIRTDKSVAKKVSGTALAGILSCSPWSSPFQVACNLLGLCSEDIGNKPAVKFGQKYEGPIIKYLGKTYPEIGAFISAEGVGFEKREGDHDSWVSDFEDDTFAGHVDGIVFGVDGETYILEIKTSANIQSWEDGVPEYYRTQVMLYNHFITKKDKAYVGLGIRNRDYIDSWTPNEENTFLFPMEIDQKECEDMLAKVKAWYGEYILKGVTPDYDPTIQGDVDMFNHLSNLTDDMGDISELVDQYHDLDEQEKAHDSEIAEIRKQKDDLKVRLKDWFDCHGVNGIDSASGEYHAELSIRTSKKIDPELLRVDGIDPEKYMTTTTTKTFTVKKKKE